MLVELFTVNGSVRNTLAVRSDDWVWCMTSCDGMEDNTVAVLSR